MFYWKIVDTQCHIHFCCKEGWLSFMYTHTFSYYFPLWFIKGYWIQFPGLYSRAFSSVQFSCSVMSDSLQHHGLSITNSQSLLRLMSIKLVMPSNHLILCRPLLLRLQSFPTSGSFPMSQLFASGGQSIGVSASVSVLPMNIQDWFSFRMDWLDLLAIHGTLKSLLQHHSSKPSILQCSAIFIV